MRTELKQGWMPGDEAEKTQSANMTATLMVVLQKRQSKSVNEMLKGIMGNVKTIDARGVLAQEDSTNSCILSFLLAETL